MLRYAIVLWLCSSVALAKPKVAVAPIAGDSGGKVADAIVGMLAGKAKVTSPDATGRALGDNDLDDKSAKKLFGKLGVDAVIGGSLDKKGKKKTLHLTVYAKGASAKAKSFPYKSADAFKDDDRDDVVALVSHVKAEANDDDDDRPKKKVAKRDDDDDDGAKVRKRKKHRGDDDKPRAAGPAYRIDAGATYGVRRLTYDSTSTAPPPTTGTAAPSGRIAVELFPLSGGAAGFGLYGGYDKTIGLSITIPGTAQSVAIDQAHYWIGARYRFVVGESSALGLGVAYDSRHYIANRSNLTNPDQLDTPDCDYGSIAPGVWFAMHVTPKTVFVAELDALLLLSSGAIASTAQYGHATAYGADAMAGIDLPVSDQFVARIALQYSQIDFSFDKMNGANQRGVTAATDRSIGLVGLLAATF